LTQGFFLGSVSPRPAPEYSIGDITHFYENHGEIHNCDTYDKLFTGVNDTRDITGVTVIGDKFFAGVNDTGDYALSRIFMDSMTPAINLSLVTTPPRRRQYGGGGG
jgi:hypothetical protein